MRNVNSGIALSDPECSPSQESSPSTDKVVDPELCDDASDETWTPSIDDEESDDDLDLEDKSSVWQEVPIRYADVAITFNKVDSDLEYGYKEEVKEIKKRILREFNNLSSRAVKKTTNLNATQVMNALYNSKFLFSVLGFQNKLLAERKKSPMDVKEYEFFLRCFFGLCFYRCSLSDVLKHPVS